MLKKGLRMFCVIALSVALIGCGSNKSEAENKEPQGTEDVKVDAGKEDIAEDDAAKVDTEQKTENTEPGAAVTEAVIKIYFANEDATGFSEENVTLETLSGEEVLEALIEKGVMAADIKVKSLTQSEKDGEKVLDLDFSPELGTYMNSLGTTGEYMTMGSICNTYLEAYGCKKIKITVDGEVLATGHAEYPGYMEKFK